MTPLRRLHDWQLRFAAFERARRATPFAWGSNDCATFAADCVEALTGERLLPKLRTATTARQAMRIARDAGGLRALSLRALGNPVAPAFARPGDIVLLRVGRHEALGVCNGTVAIGPSPRGVVSVEMQCAECAWMVG